MTQKSTGFKFFAKVMGGSYAFCCSSRVNFTLQVTLMHKNLKIFMTSTWKISMARKKEKNSRSQVFYKKEL